MNPNRRLEESAAQYLAHFAEAQRDSVEAYIFLVVAGEDIRNRLNDFLSSRVSGLTLPRFTLLRCLYFAGRERLTLTEIGRQLAVTPGNVTQLVDALERDGLVERVSSEADRRVTYAALTQRGEELCKDLVPHVVQMMHDHTSDLTDEERSTLTSLLKRIRLSLFDGD